MKPFYLYILHCGDGSYYTGHTDDLEARIAAHEHGAAGGYTAERLPVTVEYIAEFTTRADALERERQIKGWSREKKRALIDGDWARLKSLSRSSSTKFGR